MIEHAASDSVTLPFACAARAASAPAPGHFGVLWGASPAMREVYRRIDKVARTAAPHAPWYVVPADAKWFTRVVVAAAIVEAMERLDLAYPAVDAAVRAEFAQCRKWLVEETG